MYDPTPVSFSYLEKHFIQWSKPFILREIGNVLFFPKTDREYRANDFVRWMKDNLSLSVKYVDVRTREFEVLYDEGMLLASNQPHIFVGVEQLLRQGEDSTINSLVSASKRQGVGTLLLWETINFLDEMKDVDQLLTDVFQQSYLYPLYSLNEAVEFGRYLSQKWELKVCKQDLIKIYEFTGGFFWLIKDVLRSMHLLNLSIDEALCYDSFQSKSRMIVDELSRYSPDLTQFLESSFFKKMNFVSESGEIPQVFVEIINRCRKDSLEISDDSIYLGRKDVLAGLSESLAKVLLYLANRPALTIKKDEIARVYWGFSWQNKYSDWSLSQLICRIRTHLTRYEVPIAIKTVRGEGYVCLL